MSRGSFLDLLAQSPVKPMLKHALIAGNCTDELGVFIAALNENDWQGAIKSRERIVELEHEADGLKREIRGHLPKSLFLPVARADLLDLIRLVDRMPNTAKDISGLMTGRKMQIPDGIRTSFTDFAAKAVSTARHASESVERLDDLFRAAFRGEIAKTLEVLVQRLDELEHETDEAEIAVRSELFAIEGDIAPIDVVFLYEVVKEIGQLADRAQQVGHRLLMLVAK
jgi:predicted phosphate transport protein (TIGR00153 family)